MVGEGASLEVSTLGEPTIPRSIAATTLLLVALLVPLVAQGGEPPERAASSTAWDGTAFIAHEWGTLTTVQGSDGSALGGLMHDDRDLPSFVHDIRSTRGVTGVHGKMETPVIYFYAPREIRVRVDVRFPRGTISQWYPAATRVNHVGRDASKTAPDAPLTEHKDGFITWGTRRELAVLAPGAETHWPEVEADDPWRFCREVDANGLRMCSVHGERVEKQRGRWAVGTEEERCLFYRGLADFGLPVQGRVHRATESEDAVSLDLTLTNTHADPATEVFLVYVKDGRAGLTYLPKLEETKHLEMELPLLPRAEADRKLARAMADRLTATGLFHKEAVSMTNTWKHAWFGEEGLRVLYVLPSAMIERELPLTVETHRREDERPTWEIVRTFVGRTELLSPEREADLRKTMEVLSEIHGEDPAALAKAAEAHWGRFATPFMQRLRATATDKTFAGLLDAGLKHLAVRR